MRSMKPVLASGAKLSRSVLLRVRLRQHRLLLFWLLCNGYGPRRAILHEVGRHRLAETDNHGLGLVGGPCHHRVDDGIVLDGVRLEVAARRFCLPVNRKTEAPAGGDGLSTTAVGSLVDVTSGPPSVSVAVSTTRS